MGPLMATIARATVSGGKRRDTTSLQISKIIVGLSGGRGHLALPPRKVAARGGAPQNDFLVPSRTASVNAPH